VVSSRPVGYPAGLLRKLNFLECELLDFTESQTEEYARHWCTAIRLARNESLAEARREGAKDGDTIVAGFKGHPHIKSLARNPLMLSAICLVNYFENGRLPTDRAVLYRLCVEGLLHNWDQRRGIRSDFTFDEKLRVSREIALRMQVDDTPACLEVRGFPSEWLAWKDRSYPPCAGCRPVPAEALPVPPPTPLRLVESPENLPEQRNVLLDADGTHAFRIS
jgi:hypothetical protein